MTRSDEATFTSAADLQEASAGVNGQRSPSVHPRSCEHVGADGSRCRGWKVKGERLCAGHLGRGVAANPAAYARGAAARSAEIRHGKAEARKRRALDVYRDAVEENAQSFVDARLQIINDQAAPAGDRLRAMEQLESRALGKPKESVTVDTEESETERALKALTPEERLALWQKRGLHSVG
jgi:hypothetical protein